MIRAEWEQRSTVMVLERDAWGGAKASGLYSSAFRLLLLLLPSQHRVLNDCARVEDQSWVPMWD